MDRVYLDTASACALHDRGWKRKILIEKADSRTTVVWNPWEKIAAGMADLGAETYRQFVCVEAVVGPLEEKVLAAGESHELRQTIRVEGE